jgi:hypothetical protein
LLAHLLLVAALQSSPAPAASTAPVPAASSVPAPAPTEDPNVIKLARAQYDAFASGKVDQSLYPQPVPAAAIAQVQAGLSSLGAVKSVTLVKTTSVQGSQVYVYKFTCANGAAIETLALKDGKISGIYFSPAQ